MERQKLILIYTQRGLYLSLKHRDDAQLCQDYPDYMTHLGAWSVAELRDYLLTEYPILKDSIDRQLTQAVSATDDYRLSWPVNR
ncbi:hypothetical protein [Agitococcus lubricus]|uniref:Uncharacterized protein n=1 Tax=Agitococcus lubricus TaxID=1077255 RepID=A0A2T5J3M0_9GAMM|nr:hypothetical protein [Agitococcus lubricus]PTQ91205.1 hypothetical protein C8N29_101278 [Agitococcus lubricus]